MFPGLGLLSDWPVPYPEDWVERVNRPETEAELQAIRQSVKRGQPFGSEGWVDQTAKRPGLGQTLRPQGRPPRSRPKVEPEIVQRSLFE